MAGDGSPAFNPFTCPNCNALYQVVKVEAGPETDNREITCRACGGPLMAREGKFVFKYFLLKKHAVPAQSLERLLINRPNARLLRSRTLADRGQNSSGARVGC